MLDSNWRADDELTGVGASRFFHRLTSVLPETQKLTAVAPDVPVREALRLMRDNSFSQLPIVAGQRVIGMFSYRHFSQQLAGMDLNVAHAMEMPVSEFSERASFEQLHEDFTALFSRFDLTEAVLVGSPESVLGIVAPLDVLKYLYWVASPFVLIGEIERAVRFLITSATDEMALEKCALVSLSSHYGDREPPTRLEDMSFGDYVQIVGDGRNWERYRPVFGGTRALTRTKLDRIREIRNGVFHFREDPPIADYEELVAHREWILLRVEILEAQEVDKR